MIVDHGNVILSLNKRCKPIIDPDFMLVPYGGDGYSLIVYHNKGTSKAVNRLDDGGAAEVDVEHWFKNYYLYVEVKFIFANEIPKRGRKVKRVMKQCSISISVFKQIENHIVQLFRAEWDDYNNDQEIHPQPHWHFTAGTSLANTYEEFMREYGTEGLLEILEFEKLKVPDLKKFHFAMNGRWADGLSHVRSIEDVEVVNWFCGLISSIRKELEYIE
ncbi:MULTISPECIES: hypothetical protein [Butyricimonas]|uniref:hypothetical protein n=1 Tax=Butyricimonas TaxID=574697 RepID=UPI00111CE02E|nr:MULTISPECIES: hypothetical protein [Butyricimonas]